jgi:hypothetical protein
MAVYIDCLVVVERACMSSDSCHKVGSRKPVFTLLKVSKPQFVLIEWMMLELTLAIVSITMHWQGCAIAIDQNCSLIKSLLKCAPDVITTFLLPWVVYLLYSVDKCYGILCPILNR